MARKEIFQKEQELIEALALLNEMSPLNRDNTFITYYILRRLRGKGYASYTEIAHRKERGRKPKAFTITNKGLEFLNSNSSSIQ